MEETKDWEVAEKHLRAIMGHYGALAGTPGVNVYFGLMMLQRLLNRFEQGERTDELYQEMIDAE